MEFPLYKGDNTTRYLTYSAYWVRQETVFVKKNILKSIKISKN